MHYFDTDVGTRIDARHRPVESAGLVGARIDNGLVAFVSRLRTRHRHERSRMRFHTISGSASSLSSERKKRALTADPDAIRRSHQTTMSAGRRVPRPGDLHVPTATHPSAKRHRRRRRPTRPRPTFPRSRSGRGASARHRPRPTRAFCPYADESFRPHRPTTPRFPRPPTRH